MAIIVIARPWSRRTLASDSPRLRCWRSRAVLLGNNRSNTWVQGQKTSVKIIEKLEKGLPDNKLWGSNSPSSNGAETISNMSIQAHKVINIMSYVVQLNFHEFQSPISDGAIPNNHWVFLTGVRIGRTDLPLGPLHLEARGCWFQTDVISPCEKLSTKGSGQRGLPSCGKLGKDPPSSYLAAAGRTTQVAGHPLRSWWILQSSAAPPEAAAYK